ncbi:MAG: histidine kinase [Kofleriaceae bacterium]
MHGLQTYVHLAPSGRTTAGWALADAVVTFAPWLAATPLIFRLAERAPVRGRADARHLGFHLACAVVASVLAHAWLTMAAVVLRDGLPALLTPVTAARFQGMITRTFAPYFLLYLAVVGIGHAVRNAAELRRRALDAATLSRDLARAEVRALQAQVRPHFLFNALHTVSALVGNDDAAARRTLASLASLLRASLAAHDPPWTTLAEERAVIDAYLDVEHARFGERLVATVEIPAALGQHLVPSFVLQPLVENAVRHAVARTTSPVHISVAASADHDTLRLRVLDDGPEPPPAGAPGVGLANLAGRLALLYDGRAQLTHGAHASGRGFEARITLPLRSVEA